MSTRKSEIITELKADTSNFTRGLSKAKTEARDFKTVTDKLTGSFKGVFSGLRISLGAAGITAGLVAAGRSALKYAEEIENTANATGLTETQVQLLGNAAISSGQSISGLQNILVKLNEAVNTEEGRAQLAKIGLTAKDSAGAFDQLSQKMKNASGQDLADMSDIFGAKFMKYATALKEWKGFSAEEAGGNFVDLTKLKAADSWIDGMIAKAKIFNMEMWRKAYDSLFPEQKTDGITNFAPRTRGVIMDAGAPVQDFDFLSAEQILEESKKWVGIVLPNLKEQIKSIKHDPYSGLSKDDFVLQESVRIKDQFYEKLLNRQRDFQDKAKDLKDRYGDIDDPNGFAAKFFPKSVEKYQVLMNEAYGVGELAKEISLLGLIDGAVGKIYDNSMAAETKIISEKIKSAQQILALGEQEKDTTNSIFNLKEKILKLNLELNDESSDVIDIAKTYNALKRAEKDLEGAITSEKQKQNKEKEEQALKDFKFSDDLSELKEKEAEAMLGKGMLILPSVDNYRQTGKFSGWNQDTDITQDLQIAGNELLKDIREEIKKLEFQNKYQ